MSEAKRSKNGQINLGAALGVKGYGQAAAVLMGGALEQALKSRARSLSIDIDQKTTLSPLIIELKADPFRVFTEFEAKRLEAITKMGNDAAHGNTFNYSIEQVRSEHIDTGPNLSRSLYM